MHWTWVDGELQARVMLLEVTDGAVQKWRSVRLEFWQDIFLDSEDPTGKLYIDRLKHVEAFRKYTLRDTDEGDRFFKIVNRLRFDRGVASLSHMYGGTQLWIEHLGLRSRCLKPKLLLEVGESFGGFKSFNGAQKRVLCEFPEMRPLFRIVAAAERAWFDPSFAFCRGAPQSLARRVNRHCRHLASGTVTHSHATNFMHPAVTGQNAKG
jgi:hypothetical protein